MVVTFTAHNVDFGQTSKGVIEYLGKENGERLDDFWEQQENPSAINEDEINIEKNLFFNNSIDKNNEQIFLNDEEAKKLIDSNISSNSKERESKFYMLNVSPSKAEIEHIKNIAELEIERQGIGKNEKAELLKSEQGTKFLNDMRNDLIHQQLREYSKDVMRDYADNFNREVFANPHLLPNRKEEKIINDKSKEAIKSFGFEVGSNEYKIKLDELKQQFAKEMGKDFSKRKMTVNDLVWVGKVEEKRTYKANDKWVMQNKKIYKEINSIKNSEKPDHNKISILENRLNRDRTTNEIVREGLLKGGDNYHVHIIVSRYTNCPNSDKKVALSPLANHRKGKVADTNKSVGFDRDNFRNKVENSFDTKFKFQRVNTYENYKIRKLRNRNRVNRTVQNSVKSSVNSLKNYISKPIKNEIARNTGINEIRQLNPMNGISKELGFRIPMSIPKTPLDGAIKIVRFAINKIIDSSKGY